MKRIGTPNEDDCRIEKFEMEFAVPVYLTPEDQNALHEIFQRIIDRDVNQFHDGVHWLFGTGCKPHWSQQDARFLGKTPDPNAPEKGGPEYDDTVLYFESSAREFVDEEEAARVRKRRERKKQRDTRGGADGRGLPPTATGGEGV